MTSLLALWKPTYPQSVMLIYGFLFELWVLKPHCLWPVILVKNTIDTLTLANFAEEYNEFLTIVLSQYMLTILMVTKRFGTKCSFD